MGVGSGSGGKDLNPNEWVWRGRLIYPLGLGGGCVILAGAAFALAISGDRAWIAESCSGLFILMVGIAGAGAHLRQLRASPEGVDSDYWLPWIWGSQSLPAARVRGFAPDYLGTAGRWRGRIRATATDAAMVIDPKELQAKRGEVAAVLRALFGDAPALKELRDKVCSEEAVELSQSSRLTISVARKATDHVGPIVLLVFVAMGFATFLQTLSLLKVDAPLWLWVSRFLSALVFPGFSLLLLWLLALEPLRGGRVREVVIEGDRLLLNQTLRRRTIPASDILGVRYHTPIHLKAGRSFVDILFRWKGRRTWARIPEDRVDIEPRVLAGALLHRYGEWLGPVSSKAPNTSGPPAV